MPSIKEKPQNSIRANILTTHRQTLKHLSRLFTMPTPSELSIAIEEFPIHAGKLSSPCLPKLKIIAVFAFWIFLLCSLIFLPNLGFYPNRTLSSVSFCLYLACGLFWWIADSLFKKKFSSSSLKSQVKDIIEGRITHAKNIGFMVNDQITELNGNNVLLIDNDKQIIKIIEFLDNIDKFELKIRDTTFEYNDIQKITFVTEPKELKIGSDMAHNYVIGGGLVGGVGGMIVGAVIASLVETIKGPKEVVFRFSIIFHLSENTTVSFPGIRQYFNVVRENVPEFEAFATHVISTENTYLATLSKYLKHKFAVQTN